ncbi:MAG TPA: sulfurtransferase complex subunit TusB [Methylococcus sp.]|nr:sulfurtransferase complex subunit TusB [Methylococcus sp.]
MRALHLVHRSPFENNVLRCCVARAARGDSVLLLENAVYAALLDGAMAGVVADATKWLRMAVLIPDLEARGLAGVELLPDVEAIDYDGFVDLAVAYPVIVTWS